MDIARSRKLLTITIIFFWASEYCHAPYFTPYLQTLGFAAQAIGVMTGVYGFTQALVRIPLGVATDATGWYKKTIVMGTAFTTISSFGLMFARSFAGIVFCRFLAGVAASSWLAFTVLYNAYFSADESVHAMTNVNAFNSAGKLLAFALGLFTATLWGYKVPLVCSFLTGVAACCCAIRLKPVPLKREPFRFSHVFSVLKDPSVLIASLFAIVMQFYLQGTVFSFTSAAARAIGATALEIGISTVLFTVVQLAGARFMGRRLKQLRTSVSVMISFLLMAVSCTCVAFAKQMPLIYLGQICGGLANLALSAVLMAVVVRHTPQEKQSTAMGLYQALYGLGMTLGPVCVGSIVNVAGYAAAYLTVAGVMLAAAALAPVLMRFAKET